MSPNPPCTSYEIVNHSGNSFALTYYALDTFLDEKWLDPKSDFLSMFQASVKDGLRNTLGETVMLTIVPLSVQLAKL